MLVPPVAGASPGDVHITMHDGRVSIAAREATLSEVLDEWTRVGGSTIVNSEAAKGVPITIDLIDVPEGEALSVLLRSVGGYVAVARGPQSTNASRFARIQITPARTIASPPPAGPAAVVPVSKPPLPAEFVTGVARILGPDGQPVQDDQDGAPPFRPSPRPPGFWPGDPPAQPAATPPPTSTMPGTRTPGVILPAPPPAQPALQR